MSKVGPSQAALALRSDPPFHSMKTTPTPSQSASLIGRLLILLGLFAILLTPIQLKAVPVDLELSLVVDASGSVDNTEWALMMQGYAKAFRNPAFIALATSGVQRSIAVNVLELSGSTAHVITWRKIDSTASSQAFATLLENLTRQVPNNTGTDISKAIDTSVATFNNNGFEAPVQVLSVAGDGDDNIGADPAASRDAALAAGIDSIHGIVIGDAVGGVVETHYRTQVIAGESPLLCTAVDFTEFADAILFKLSAVIQQSTGECPIVPTSIAFDKTNYTIKDNAAASGFIRINPIPTGGLYSQGLRITVRDLGGNLAGFITPTPSAKLNFDGMLLGNGARHAPNTGVAGVKGTSNFSDLSRPTEISERIANFTLGSLPAGNYTMELSAWNELGPTESIFVTGCCQSLDSVLTFQPSFLLVEESDPLAGLGITVVAAPAIDRQTGLIKQSIRITNNGTSIVDKFRLFVESLPADVSLWNRHGLVNSIPYIDYLQPLAVGASVTISLEYFRANRDANFTPTFRLALTTATVPNPNPGGVINMALRVVQMSGSGILIEFATETGKSYSVEYSDDMTTWKVSQPVIQGNGTKLQWIDSGPPKTESLPGASRFYRITTPQ